MFLNIYSKGKHPANELSNFACHPFDFDGYTEIPCMEAFLQSLKFQDSSEQQILYLSAKEAKTMGSQKMWSKFLYWKGKKINRFSREYFKFVLDAYKSLSLNDDFKKALIASRGRILLHTIGRSCRKATVLICWEFTYILSKLRKEALRGEKRC